LIGARGEHGGLEHQYVRYFMESIGRSSLHHRRRDGYIGGRRGDRKKGEVAKRYR